MVVKILEELEVGPSNCKPVAKVVMEPDMLHSPAPRFKCVVGLEHSLAEATFVALGGPHNNIVYGNEVCQAMIDPFLFVCKFSQAVEEIERAFKTTARRRRLHDTIEAELKCPWFNHMRNHRRSAAAGAGAGGGGQSW